MSTIFCAHRVVADHGALLCWVFAIGNVCRSNLHPVWNHKSHKQEIKRLRNKRSVRRYTSAFWSRANLEREQKYRRSRSWCYRLNLGAATRHEEDLVTETLAMQARRSNDFECKLNLINKNASQCIDKSSFFSLWTEFPGH